MLYENKYFKIVFNQNLKSTVGESDIIIESLTQEKYIVTFTDMDYDTEGYMSDSSLVADLSDYTISSEKIHFNRCKNNLSFIKGKYKITDQANHNEIESGTIDKKFERPLVILICISLVTK